jgi:hypothetical protein
MSEQGKASSQRDPTVISEIKRDPVDTDGHGHVAQTTGASCGPFGPDAPCCGSHGSPERARASDARDDPRSFIAAPPPAWWPGSPRTGVWTFPGGRPSDHALVAKRWLDQA